MTKLYSFTSLIFLYSIYLFIIQLTKAKKASNTILLYSFSIQFSFYLLYNNIKTLLRVLRNALLLILICSIILICKSLWIKTSAEWLNVNVTVIFARFPFRELVCRSSRKTSVLYLLIIYVRYKLHYTYLYRLWLYFIFMESNLVIFKVS